jgi:hypothetical protein
VNDVVGATLVTMPFWAAALLIGPVALGAWLTPRHKRTIELFVLAPLATVLGGAFAYFMALRDDWFRALGAAVYVVFFVGWMVRRHRASKTSDAAIGGR